MNEEDDVKKAIVWAVAALALLAGCGKQADKASTVPVEPKWKGQPYRIAFDTKAVKPNPAGVAIPAIQYTANPEALEKRVVLVVRFDASAVAKQGPIANRMIMAPVDIAGAEGALPADYMSAADKGSIDVPRGVLRQGKDRHLSGAGPVVALAHR